MIPLGFASNAATGSKSRLEAQNSRLDCLKKGGHCFHTILKFCDFSLQLLELDGCSAALEAEGVEKMCEQSQEATVVGHLHACRIVFFFK